jgi:hypothetical protein
MSLIRIAMWSGPRNISTAMMRAWENRDDTVVIDEPFYGPFLAASGEDHPMKHAVIDHQGEHYEKVLQKLLAPQADSVEIFYQKHMAHHMLDMDFVNNHLITPFRHAFFNSVTQKTWSVPMSVNTRRLLLKPWGIVVR